VLLSNLLGGVTFESSLYITTHNVCLTLRDASSCVLTKATKTCTNYQEARRSHIARGFLAVQPTKVCVWPCIISASHITHPGSAKVKLERHCCVMCSGVGTAQIFVMSPATSYLQPPSTTGFLPSNQGALLHQICHTAGTEESPIADGPLVICPLMS
jgi:hypothetical protein